MHNKKYFLPFMMVFYFANVYAMFCPVVPDNFKIIHSGDTLQKVIDTCGPPEDKKVSMQTTETNASIPVGGGVSSGSYVQVGNTVNYYGSQSYPAYINQKNVQQYEITDLYYPTYILKFVNGILVDRQQR